MLTPKHERKETLSKSLITIYFLINRRDRACRYPTDLYGAGVTIRANLTEQKTERWHTVGTQFLQKAILTQKHERPATVMAVGLS
jgi:hypothetical protein